MKTEKASGKAYWQKRLRQLEEENAGLRVRITQLECSNSVSNRDL